MVNEAWNQLKEAFEQQVHGSNAAKRRNPLSGTPVSREFKDAIANLQKAVTRHCGAPTHRPQADPKRVRAIDRLRRQGKSEVGAACPVLELG